MSEQADRDALAEVLASRSHEPREPFPHEYLAADLILDSDWLAQRDRRVRAEAWDEGYEAGRDDELFDQRGLSTDSDAHEYPHANPYRADQIEAGDV